MKIKQKSIEIEITANLDSALTKYTTQTKL
uniref:Uncharacterized protein n=1 Tax=Rhizophora mucronata TaxID=61149 RepID=A0A2P2IN36_RHIMU